MFKFAETEIVQVKNLKKFKWGNASCANLTGSIVECNIELMSEGYYRIAYNVEIARKEDTASLWYSNGKNTDTYWFLESELTNIVEPSNDIDKAIELLKNNGYLVESNN